MYYLTRHNPKQDYLKKTLQNSVITGYQQIFETALFLKKSEHPYGKTKEIFAIIITFKDLLLGNSSEIWQEFMNDVMADKLEKTLYNNLPLPPEKIFVISSYSFNHMLSYSIRKGIALSGCLRKVVTRNMNPETQRYLFHDYFNDIQIKLLDLPLLNDSFIQIQDRVGKALKKGEEYTNAINLSQNNPKNYLPGISR